MKEKRRFARISKVLPVKLSAEEGDIVTETKNVSGNGAYCAVDKPLPLMSKLDIVLLIPHQTKRAKQVKKIHCGGVVVRQESARNNGKHAHYVGIYFHDISEKDRKILLAYVKSSHHADEEDA